MIKSHSAINCRRQQSGKLAKGLIEELGDTASDVMLLSPKVLVVPGQR